jgi:hypothetical protein
MYESRREPLLPRRRYVLRVAKHAAIAFLLALSSLLVGMWGYSHYENLGWRDAFMNAAMLLGGMGPVHTPQTPGGKVFAGLYALYAGLVFLVVVGIVLAPVVHRVLHRFHLQEQPPK